MKKTTKINVLIGFALLINLISCTKKEKGVFSYLVEDSDSTEYSQVNSDDFEEVVDGEREIIVMDDDSNYKIVGRSDTIEIDYDTDKNEDGDFNFLSNNTELQNSYDGEYCAKYLVTNQDEKHYLTVWSQLIKGRPYLCRKIDNMDEEDDEKEDEVECKPTNAYFNAGYITESFAKDVSLMAKGSVDSINFENGTLFDALHYTNGTKENFTSEAWLHRDIPLGHIAKISHKDGSSLEIVSFNGKNGSSGHCVGENN